jgi:hypothetical protein
VRENFCSKWETVEDVEEEYCIKCGKRKHLFWYDPVGDFLSYLCEPRPWCNKVIAIAHNAKAFDHHFILNRAVILNCQPELIRNGLKNVCMKVEHLTFIDSVSFMPLPLRKLPDAFGLKATKSWYPHLFKTMQNINYVRTIPDIAMYGVCQMSDSEIREFLEWYEGQKAMPFVNRRVLESYSQDDVTVMRQACQLFRREFLNIANIDVFQESLTIASACNKVFRKLFLHPNSIGLIPTGGYSGGGPYSKNR